MKTKLQNISQESIKKQSIQVFEKLIKLPTYQNSRAISIFLSMPGEINTKPIVENIFNSGKICFVPMCINDEMHMVRLDSLEEYEELPLNSWGIPEPVQISQDCFDFGGLDLIIMPGLAFDLAGNRIGYGRGYYDKFLSKAFEFSKANGKQPPYCVAIALEQQIVDQVPTEDTDIKPNQILYIETIAS